MRLKYRKIILFIIIFTMGMGMVTFSVGVDNNNKGKVLTEEQIESAKTADLVKNDNKEVMKLIENYNKAKLEGDADKFALYVNDESMMSKEEFETLQSYMEGYENVDCYVIDIPIEDHYVVYVYREYKMKGLDTLIPGVVRQYVCPDDKGNLVVYSGEVESSIYEFIENTKENPEVKKLINMVDNRIEQIKEEDSTVKTFLDKLDEVVNGETKGDEQPTKAPSEAPDASKTPTSTQSAEATNQPMQTKEPTGSNESETTESEATIAPTQEAA